MADKTAAELKREREQAARRALFVSGADERPANTDLSALLGEEQPEPANHVEAAVEAVSVIEPEAVEAAERVPDAEIPVQAAPKPPAARKSAPKPLPWATAETKPTGVTFSLDPELNAKMVWITENVPKMSKQRIVREALAEYVDKVIAERYKP